MEGPTGVSPGRTEVKLSLGSGAAASTGEALGWARAGAGPRRGNPWFCAPLVSPEAQPGARAGEEGQRGRCL